MGHGIQPDSDSSGSDSAPNESTASTAETVYIPSGLFFMGCDDQVTTSCELDERPLHPVYLDGYYIDKYEVTNRALPGV